MTELRTRRLVLHLLTPDEAHCLIDGVRATTDRWAPDYPGPLDLRGATAFLDACAAGHDPRPFGTFEIRRAEDGRAIGGLGFHGPPGEDGAVTVGYGLVPSARGAGYATESLRALLEFAWSRGVTRARADTGVDNLASQRVLDAVGMRCVAENRVLRWYELPAPDNGPASTPVPVPGGGSA